ncbi:hypothetical protein MKW94_007907 [Papaver nudicaule]|uniref:Agenet domain-containing protein n=1 Tax=Papaver nudicaule TaxID=74823 RepID=A0AA41VLX0_PAPNU|nr:hypothetical protein [Papaver nudicaule]MCL7051297.1 hypothetical protein [Papaver nudicaule]
MELKRGDRVEVTSKEEGFVGSYYSAKILSKLVPTNEYLLEYETLCTEDDETKLLREIVDSKNVRPYPPEIKLSKYSVLDKVDAFDNDGWWVGRVSAVVLGEDGKSNSYYVYFENSRCEIAYPVDKLRIHQEFREGKWTITNKKW